jgi:uncharacterized protein YwqG
MWSSSELEGQLRRQAELAAWAARLAAMARPCIIFVPGTVEEAANAPLGSSRLGGDPDMPPDLEWPLRPAFDPPWTWRGPMPEYYFFGSNYWFHRVFRTQKWKQSSANWERARRAESHVRNRAWPLSFVAQIDFSELHAVHALDGFPSAGRLLLFCDPFDWPWGKRDDQAHARALFTEQPTETLVRRRPPSEFDSPEAGELRPRRYVFKPRILRPTAWLLPPPLGSREMVHLQAEAPDAWAPGKDAFLAYLEFWDDIFTEHPETFGEQGEMIHQVGGVAFSIQEPVEAEAARFAGEAAGLADNWQLVLQIDSDIEVGMEWGDVGRLYLCTREDDLSARHFDRCWMVMQCY